MVLGTSRVQKSSRSGGKAGSRLRISSTASSPIAEPSAPARRPVGNQWRDSKRTSLMVSTLQAAAFQAMSNPPSFCPPIAPKAMREIQSGNQSTVVNNFGNVNINPGPNPNAPVFTPSQGPAPSVALGNNRAPSRAPSLRSNKSYRGRIHNAVCTLSGLTKADFAKGQIISVPYHTANMNPNLDATDRHLRITCDGPVYTKRRMMVVLWTYLQDMYCVPLYTWQFQGLTSRPPFLRKEYVAIKNVGDPDQNENPGNYPAIEAQLYNPLHKMSTVYITGGVKIACCEDIKKCGRLTESGYQQLLALWRDLSKVAQNERW